MEDFTFAVMKGAIESGISNKRTSDGFVNAFSKYIKEVKLPYITLNIQAIKEDTTQLTDPYGLLFFLRGAFQLSQSKGLFIVFDEINGIANNPDFAPLFKGFIDVNEFSDSRVPVLLMLCGVPNRWSEMVAVQQSVDRIFNIIALDKLSEAEMQSFITEAFASSGITVQERALDLIIKYSAGLPKVMHIICDWAYILDSDGVITYEDSLEALVVASEDIGKRYVDAKIMNEITNAQYLSILETASTIAISVDYPKFSFTKVGVLSSQSNQEMTDFDSFIIKINELNIIRDGVEPDSYIFTNIMVPLYVWLNSSTQGLIHTNLEVEGM
jgi:hypothetical protein